MGLSRIRDGEAVPPIGADERLLREMVWLSHGCPFPALYGDDGEMQCSGPCRVGDFLRTPVGEIQRRLMEYRLILLTEHLARVRLPSDMDPSVSLELIRQEDGDVCLSVRDQNGTHGVEFCTMRGGGKRFNTLAALKKLMEAMKADGGTWV